MCIRDRDTAMLMFESFSIVTASAKCGARSTLVWRWPNEEVHSNRICVCAICDATLVLQPWSSRKGQWWTGRKASPPSNGETTV
eukprot:7258194-Pyramimonas_sp.AAC.1